MKHLQEPRNGALDQAKHSAEHGLMLTWTMMEILTW